MKRIMACVSSIFLTFSLLAASLDTVVAAQCGFKHKFSQKDERGTRTVKVYESDPLGNQMPTKVLVYVTLLRQSLC